MNAYELKQGLSALGDALTEMANDSSSNASKLGMISSTLMSISHSVDRAADALDSLVKLIGDYNEQTFGKTALHVLREDNERLQAQVVQLTTQQDNG